MILSRMAVFNVVLCFRKATNEISLPWIIASIISLNMSWSFTEGIIQEVVLKGFFQLYFEMLTE